MYLILFVLNDPDKLDNIVEAWEQAGVSGVTVLTSTGLERMRAGIRDDLPLMPGLDDFYKRGEEFHRTIFTVVKNDKLVKKVVAATESIVGDMNEPNSGVLIVLPTAQVYGLDRKS